MVVGGDDNTVNRNNVSQTGIILSGNHNTITRNHVSEAPPCPDGCGIGISFEGGHDNLIARNLVARSGAAGIRLAAFPTEGEPTLRTVVRRNVVVDAGTDGLLVESTATDSLLEQNLSIGAGDDGIDVDNTAATLTRNAATRNHDLGIEAVPGVTDGGGNKADRTATLHNARPSVPLTEAVNVPRWVRARAHGSQRLLDPGKISLRNRVVAGGRKSPLPVIHQLPARSPDLFPAVFPGRYTKEHTSVICRELSRGDRI